MSAFLYLTKKKFADRNPVSGEVTECKVVEVTDRFGPLTARIQMLTSRGCVGQWKGPFYIRDIALNHWHYIEYMKSSGLPLPEVHDLVPLQQLRSPPNPKAGMWKVPSSPERTSPKLSFSRQSTLEAWKRPAREVLNAPTEPMLEAREVAGGGTSMVLAILTASASPHYGQWLEEEGSAFSLHEFAYLVEQQVSDVNRRSGVTEVWVEADIVHSRELKSKTGANYNYAYFA